MSQAGPQLRLTRPNPVWDCLNSVLKVEKYNAPDDDIIGLANVSGMEMLRNEDGTGTMTALTEPLPTDDDVQQWLERPSCGGNTSSTNSPRCRILLGERAAGSMTLHVRDEVPATRFSSTLVSTSFNIPLFAVHKAVPTGCWFLDVPSRLNANGYDCCAVSTYCLTAIWSFHPETRTTNALIILGHMQSGHRIRDNFLLDLEKLENMLDQPTALPFIIADLNILHESRMVTWVNKESNDDELLISRYPDGPKRTELFYGANTRANGLTDMQRDLRTTLELTHFALQSNAVTTSVGSEAELCRLVADHEDLRAGTRCLEQIIQSLIQDTERRLVQCMRQLSTLSSRTAESQQATTIELAQTSTKLTEESRRDQAISIEIARATKIIAIESKRDSSSMKTLALVTMIYLPGTSVAAVLAMPLFKWDAPSAGGIANRRLWIYVVLTVPLTVLTVVIWWLWFRFQFQQESKDYRDEKKVD